MILKGFHAISFQLQSSLHFTSFQKKKKKKMKRKMVTDYETSMPPTKRQRISILDCNKLETSPNSFNDEPLVKYNKNNEKKLNESRSKINDSSIKKENNLNEKITSKYNLSSFKLKLEPKINENQIDISPLLLEPKINEIYMSPLSLPNNNGGVMKSENIKKICIRSIISSYKYDENESNDFNDNEDIDIFNSKIFKIMCEQLS